MRSRAKAMIITALLVVGSPAARAESLPCTGDCDGNGRVRVAELIRGVRCALSLIPERDCTPCLLVSPSVADLLAAVHSSLEGCPRPPATPTPTLTPTATVPLPPGVWMRLIPFRQCDPDAPGIAWLIGLVQRGSIPEEFLPEGVEVLAHRLGIVGGAVCLACSCPLPSSPIFDALVSENDVPEMREAGWSVAR